jgi:DNA (cytosine-5)-methyltransferase 1
MRFTFSPDAKREGCNVQALVRCLDLFCGAGGAGMGLSRAGFDVTGVDILPQPRYPFRFIQGDALAQDLTSFDFVWASPPCQAHTAMQHIRKNAHAHTDLIPAVRAKLKAWGGPWVIENVKGAPLCNAVMLCGTMFGLRIIKHRYFETSFDLPCLLPPCSHRDVYDPWHGKGRTADAMREAQGTPWIPASGGASRKRGTSGDCNNAIPPAYSEWIARQWCTANKSSTGQEPA